MLTPPRATAIERRTRYPASFRGRLTESTTHFPPPDRVRATSTDPIGGWPDFMKPILADDGDPHVLVLGLSAVEPALVSALRRIGVDTRETTGTAETLEAMSPWTRAVVVAPPLPRLRAETAVPVLERPAHAASADLMMVVPDGDEELAMRADAIAVERDCEVFAWPGEALRLTARLREAGAS